MYILYVYLYIIRLKLYYYKYLYWNIFLSRSTQYLKKLRSKKCSYDILEELFRFLKSDA